MYTNYRAYLLHMYTACQVNLPKTVPNRVRSGWDTGVDTVALPNSLDQVLNQITNTDLKNKTRRLLIAIADSIVIDNQYQITPSTADSQTLRVFVAPEFYFRSKDRSTSTTEYVEADLFMLRTVLNDFFNNFRTYYPGNIIDNWVFLCGTMVYSQNNTSHGNRLMNVMPIYAFQNKELVINRVIRKLVTSGIDGIDDPVDWNNVVEKNYSSYEASAHYLRPFNLFVEICLEHADGLLTTWKETHSDSVCCHVISAAGMNISKEHVYRRTMMIRTDGLLKPVHDDMISFFQTSFFGGIPDIKPTPRLRDSSPFNGWQGYNGTPPIHPLLHDFRPELCIYI